MDIKQWLMRSYRVHKEIEKLREEREKAYGDMFIPSPGVGEKVQTSPQNITELRYMKYLEYDGNLQKRLDELCKIKIETENLISKICDTRLRTVLFMRYVLYYRWCDIADEMNYDERHIYKLHNKALRAAEKEYNIAIQCHKEK